MFNEPASSFDDNLLPLRRQMPTQPEENPQDDPRYETIRTAVETVLTIESEHFAFNTPQATRQNIQLMTLSADTQLLMTFKGRLHLNSEEAYAQLDSVFLPYGLLPMFRQERRTKDNPEMVHVIHVIQGRTTPPNGGNMLSLVLFILTVLSVLYVGTISSISEIASTDMRTAQAIYNNILPNLWRGTPYALALLLILGAHEMGHYLLARLHKTAASLPYFLPFPFGIFGTFGAAIRLREPMRNRKVLLDIGAAGPLAGLIFAIPIVLIGLATSQVLPIQSGMVEGNSFIYALSKVLVFGRFLPDGEMDVYVNQLAWAGWTGLLVTGLNLIPVGQLDGGHVLYALLGKQAGLFYYPIIGGMLVLTMTIAPELLVFVILILFIGNVHAVPLDDITPLDNRRRWIAGLALVIFLLVFVPSPLTMMTVDRNPILPADRALMWLPLLMGILWTNRHRFIRG